MACIPESEIESLKARIDLVALVESKGIALKRRGGHFVACCSFHDEKHPSFTVTPTKRLWNCPGCKQRGDAIRFVELVDRVSFREAFDRLAKVNGAISDARAACAGTARKASGAGGSVLSAPLPRLPR